MKPIDELLKEARKGTADLSPHTGEVVELWRAVFARVKPLQRDVATVEWLTHEGYAGVSAEGEALLDLLGYLPGEEVGLHLREALHLTDPFLRLWAALSLLRRSETVPANEIEVLAANPLVRISLWEELRNLGARQLMPARWAAPEALAESALSRWLSYPTELGKYPEEIELVQRFPIEDDAGVVEYGFLFRFRGSVSPLEPGEWMAGIAGPYRKGEALDSPWSSFRRWDSMTPAEHISLLYDRCGSACTPKSAPAPENREELAANLWDAPKRPLTPEDREKLAAEQRARWAKQRAQMADRREPGETDRADR